MLDITRGRSLATTAPAPDRVGDESFPSAAQQLPGLTPGILDEYPGCTPRPRNLPEYQAACQAAQGEAVIECSAFEVTAGMQMYQGGRFLAITDVKRSPTGDVEVAMRGHGVAALRVASMTAPVYVLASTPDAIPAPGAEATEGESTAARGSART